MRKVVIISTVMLLVGLSVFSQSVPQLVNYQGRLTDADGKALTTANYKLEFNIYDASSAGNVVWGPQTFAEVPVANGYFNVILGPKDSASTPRDIAVAFSGAERYIGIKVNDGTELAPRQQILSAPFALKALHGDPVASVQAYFGVSAPAGWLICDGGTIDKSVNPEYATLIDFLRDQTKVGSEDFIVIDNANQAKLPDLRGVFLRGLDTTAVKDPGGASRAIGSYQADVIKNHKHPVYYVQKTFQAVSGTGGDEILSASGSSYDSGDNSGGDNGETRSKNVAVNYIIKY